MRTQSMYIAAATGATRWLFSVGISLQGGGLLPPLCRDRGGTSATKKTGPKAGPETTYCSLAGRLRFCWLRRYSSSVAKASLVRTFCLVGRQ